MYRIHCIGSAVRLRRLMDVTYSSTYFWAKGRPPRRRTLVKMCRLLIWGAAAWPEDVNVHWDEMRISPETSMPNPFQLSPTVSFAFGGDRDTGALIREAMQRLGIEQKAHLGRLLGTPPKLEYQYVYRWYAGQRCTGGYMMRLLALLLMDWRGYPVSDMWSIDWHEKTVEWSWDGLAGAPKPLPGNPFEWFALAPEIRRIPKRASVAVAPYPVSMVAA